MVALGAGVAWFPPNVWSPTAPAVAMVCLLMLPVAWPWRGSVSDERCTVVFMLVVLAVLAVVAGWDREAALRTVALAAAAGVLGWLAARRAPQLDERAALSVAVSALGLWAGYQTLFGFELAVEGVAQLPAELQHVAAMRLRDGRGFASLALPGHLAALLATAVPLLLGLLRSQRWRAAAAAGLAAAAVGLLASRSVLGVGLALLAVTMTASGARWKRVLWIVAVAALVAVVVVDRGDLWHLEPLRLRWQNWTTAVWAWSHSPLVGLGPGGMGQAAQAVPFRVVSVSGYAHSLPLQLLVDHGVAGIGVMVLIATWLVGRVRALWWSDRHLAVALLVVPVHNLLDFSCYRAGVLLPWAVVAGWAAAAARGPAPSGSARQARTVGRTVTVAVLSIAVGVAALDSTGRVLERAALATDDPQQSWELATRASRVAPWRLTPRMVLLNLAASGQTDPAADTLRHHTEVARWIRPQSASVVVAIGAARLADGDLAGASAAAQDAACYRPGSDRAQSLRGRIMHLHGGRSGAP